MSFLLCGSDKSTLQTDIIRARKIAKLLITADNMPMGSFLKRAAGFFKAVLPFVIEHWQAIIAFSGLIVAGLGLFFEAFRNIMRTSIILPAWVLIVVSPFVIYAVIMIVIKWIDVIRKPPYLKFTSMEYKGWKLQWDYEPTKYYEFYNITNIRPVCKKCGCKLVEHHCTTGIDGSYCPVCEENNEYPHLYRYFTYTDTVKTVIMHRIEKGLY